MPLPMVHLAVALGVHQHLGREVAPGFLLGCIAPDAIHMRADTTRSDKRHTHLREVGDLENEMVQRWLLGQLDAAPAYDELVRGYAAHLLTDRHWLQTVVADFRQQVPHGLDLRELRTLYYHDTDSIDTRLYYHAPWRPAVWQKLAIAQVYDVDELLSAPEIDQWRQRTLGWFDHHEEDLDTVPVYISDERVRQFIMDAGQRVYQTLAGWEAFS